VSIGQSASAPLLRLLNAQTVFEEILREKAISRVQLARATGMAKPTVSNVLQDLQAIGLVRETPGDQRRRGVTFELVPGSALVFGLDVGGRYLRAGLDGLDGEVLARAKVEHSGVDHVELPRLAVGLRDRLLRAAGARIDQVEAAVIGVPGIVNPANGHVCRLNPERVESYPIVEVLEQSLGHPAVVENDVNLAAIGERAGGLGAEVANFVYLSIGTGVGAGLVLRGELHRGRFGAAGEIDMPGDPDSPSEPALLAYARKAYGGSCPSTVEAIFAAADDGDKTAIRVLEEEARRIASQVVPIARVVDVELVVLGGGIGTHCGRVLDEVSRQLTGRVQFPPRLAVSTLSDTAVLTGALAFGAQNCGQHIVAERLGRRSA
jgi:predicted NBD/HSP70 family sugar kinase